MLPGCTPTTCSAGSLNHVHSSWRRRQRVAASPFSYAIYRLVPRVERGERLNVGVVVFCRPRDFLAARTSLDPARVGVLWPDLDPAAVQPHLAALERIAGGDPTAGPIAELDTTGRFHW